MSTNKQLIGLLGCGDWGRNILRDLRSLGCRVSVVARTQDSWRNAFRGGADSIVPSAARLPEVAGIVVATPTSVHAESIDSVLDRDVPIFCEKPLTNSAVAARQLVESAGDRIFVMDKWRYHTGILALAEIARSGEFGPVRGLKTRRLGWGLPHVDVDCAWILLPHELTIGLEILGQVPSVVQARAEFDREGTLVGATSVLEYGDAWHVSEIGIRTPESDRRIELVCADGTAILPKSNSDHVQIVHNPSDWNAAGSRDSDRSEIQRANIERRALTQQQPLLAELRAFVEYLNGGEKPKSMAIEGLAIVETIAEIRSIAGCDRETAPHIKFSSAA